MLCVQPSDPLDGATGKLIQRLIYVCQLRQWKPKCGMRRPSLGQNEDDLSRLTTVISPTSASLSSSTQTESPSDNNDNNSKRNNNNNNHGNSNNNNNNNNNGNGCIKTEKSSCADLVAALSAQYLPNLINSSEWQNCRKRKERQDSTSSISQDRKLIRSNSEEHLPNCQEVIRRVSSHEDFKKRTQQPPPEVNVDKENIIEESAEEQQQLVFEKNLKNSSDNLKKFFIGSGGNNGGGTDGGGGSGGNKEQLKSADGQQQQQQHSLGVHSSHHHYGQHHHHHHHHSKHRLSPCRDILKGRKDSDSELDGEHERRRHCERFSKTRPPPGRKSVSPRNRTKQSSAKHGTGKDKGGSEQSRQDTAVQSGKSADREQQHPSEPADILSDYNDNNLLEKNKAEVETPSPQSPREKLPWDQSFPNDDTPVVCQRFADHKFEHANKMDSFDRVPHPVPSNVTLKYYGDYRSAQSMQPAVKKPIPPANNMFDERIKTINRKLSGLKKKLTQFEDRFERDNGYRPTHGDKTADGAIKGIVVDIHKLRKEKNQIKADLAVFTANSAAKSAHAAVTPVAEEEKKLHKMKDTIVEIQKRLCEKRETDQRNENLELMSSNQLVEEKATVQRALLYLESIYGRPASREERDAARPLYDRYRLIKRLVNRANSISGPCGVNSQMPTILEHEALAIVGTTTPSTDISPPSATSMVQSPTDTSAASTGQSTDDSETTSSSITENIHSMTADELWEHYDAAREEKKELRRTIKEYEQKFEETTGRKMLKSDRKSIEETYALYKQKKAKLRLIDALFKKQMLI